MTRHLRCAGGPAARTFTRQQIVDALAVPKRAFQSWTCSALLALDGNDYRKRGEWRRYSARDALKLAVATSLSRAGLPASKLPFAVESIVALVIERKANCVAVLPTGAVRVFDDAGVIGDHPAFIVLRLDDLFRRIEKLQA